jgi:hypothetical protein
MLPASDPRCRLTGALISDGVDQQAPLSSRGRSRSQTRKLSASPSRQWRLFDGSFMAERAPLEEGCSSLSTRRLEKPREDAVENNAKHNCLDVVKDGGGHLLARRRDGLLDLLLLHSSDNLDPPGFDVHHVDLDCTRTEDLAVGYVLLDSSSRHGEDLGHANACRLI